METNDIEKQLANLLPDRVDAPSMSTQTRPELIKKEASDIKTKQKAKELAAIRYKESRKLHSLERKQAENEALAKELGLDEVPLGQTENQARKIAEQKNKVETIKAIEAQTVEPLAVQELQTKACSANMINKALTLQGTSRPEVLKLLTSLNINLSVQLTKQDTANLLACLLTCNEAQLLALYNNKKIPIVIKTVIKRLMEDVKLGNIDTIEKLWDRVFGKGQMSLNLPEAQQLQTGIIPNVPVSREAYIVIRDTLLK
jgi:hypothetical protein